MGTAADENWGVLLSLLPANWEALASQFEAVERLRGFDSVEAVLRTLLLHVGKGLSLRETAVQAKLAGRAEVSDVTILNRLRSAESWWRALCQLLLEESGVGLADGPQGRRMRAVDGSLIKEPGRTGSLWRLHYSVRLPSLICDHMTVTATRGKGTAETLLRFPAAPGDLVLADRGFCTPAGVEALARQGADVIVRWNSSSLPLFTPQGKFFDLLAGLRKLAETNQTGDWPVAIPGPQGLLAGRICALRKSEEAARKAQRRITRKAQQGGPETKPETLEYARYVIVFSTLPGAEFPAQSVLEWYRLRWQIGVSSQGHIVQSVRDRPRPKDSGLVAGEAPWRESKAAEPSDNILGKECAQRTRLQRTVNADVASLHGSPVAETVDHARKQQELAETSPMRQLSPAGYQRRHGVKEDVETGEALGARRRNLVGEMPAITASGKCWHRHQGDGSGRSTDDGRAAKRVRREGPGPVSIPSDKGRQG